MRFLLFIAAAGCSGGSDGPSSAVDAAGDDAAVIARDGAEDACAAPAANRVIAIAPGSEALHTCVVLEGGALRCWGGNEDGQLGSGDVAEIHAAAEAPVVLEDIRAVAVAEEHTCALTVDRGVRCWGAGYAGNLGYENDDSLLVPGDPVDLGTMAVDIAATRFSTIVLGGNARARCFGEGRSCGYETTEIGGDEPGEMPPAELELGAPAVHAVSAGAAHACAVTDNGNAVRCWGYNGGAQLGIGSKGDTFVGDESGEMPPGPVDLPDLGGSWVGVAAGGSHSCAWTSAGQVVCWGNNLSGQLGYGTNEEYVGDEAGEIAAAGVVPLGGAAVKVAAGSTTTCALLATGQVNCWGSGPTGALGRGDEVEAVGIEDTPEEAGPIALSCPAIDIGTYFTHSCAVLAGGALRCWGGNSSGVLGYGDLERRSSPDEAGNVPL